MSNPRTLPKQVLNFIRRERLWEKGDSVLLSVSGGLDSMVMLDILARHQGAHKGKLEVITFDHGLRAESAEEVQFVAQKSQGYGLSCRVVFLDMKKIANFQERARQSRQEYWKEYPEHLIATAHHGTDQAETMLFRFLRGTGLTGLRGILPKQSRKVHPLLSFFREDLEAYAQLHHLEWRNDPSNQESWRGQVRALVPVFEELRQNSMQSIARSARSLTRDEDYLQTLTKEVFEALNQNGRLKYSDVTKEHPSIQLRILRYWAETEGVVSSATTLEAFLCWRPSSGKGIRFQGGMELSYEDGWLFYQKG